MSYYKKQAYLSKTKPKLESTRQEVYSIPLPITYEEFVRNTSRPSIGSIEWSSTPKKQVKVHEQLFTIDRICYTTKGIEYVVRYAKIVALNFEM